MLEPSTEQVSHFSPDPIQRGGVLLGHVFAAADVGAVETLLISDALFRNSDFRRRTRYVQLVEDIRKAGGTVHIFSTAHVSGDQLNRLSGIAALLRFPLPDVEDQEFNENDLFG